MLQIGVSITSVGFDASMRGIRCRIRATISAGNAPAEPISDPDRVFVPAPGQRIATNGTSWHRLVNVTDPTHRITLEVALTTETGVEMDLLNHIWPANRYYEHTRLPGFQFDIDILSGIGSTVPTGIIYARRIAFGYDSRPTVAAAPRTLLHAEIDPVVPAPNREAELIRPAFIYAPGTLQLMSPPRVRFPSALNPPVIPSWPGSGQPSSAWTERWAAWISITNLWCRGPFPYHELVWFFAPLDGRPSIEFIGPNFGIGVTVFGRGEGEVRVDVSHRGRRLSSLRALVRCPARLPARAFVLLPDRSDDSMQRWNRVPHPSNWSLDLISQALESIGVQDFRNALLGANGYLRRVAMEIEEPSTVQRRVVPFEHTINIRRQLMWSDASSYAEVGKVTFVIAFCIEGWRAQGATPGIPRSGVSSFRNIRTGTMSLGIGQRTVSVNLADTDDFGTPSTSWEPPCGIPPNMLSGAKTISFVKQSSIDGAVIYLFIMSEDFNEFGVGGPTVDYDFGILGTTVAHEIGHALNLLHRAEAEDGDHLPRRSGNNLMVPHGGDNDLDIAQAKVMWQSPLVQRR